MNQGWQSEATDGTKGAWGLLSFSLSFSLSLSLSLSFSDYLSIYRSIYLSVCPSACLSIYLSIYLSLSIYLAIYLSISLSVCLSIYLCIYLSTYLSIYLYLYLSLSISLSLSLYLSIYPSIYLSIYLPIYLSNYLSIYLYNTRTSKSGANMWCFVHFDLEMCFAPQRRALFQHPNLQKWREHVVFCTFWLGNVLRATTACAFSTSKPPKVARTCGALYILTWKCASRHNGVHFSTSKPPKVARTCAALSIFTWTCASRHNGVHLFDISTSKSGPNLVCFVHFDLEMCFAPQRRALFRHLNCQKWSDTGVFCTFWLQNLLRATTACNFSSLIWPAGSAPSALASLLFDPPEPQSLEKHSVSRLSYLFAHLHLLSSYSFSSTLLSSNLPLLSASSLLCFSSVHIVGSLTSKLPSNIYIYIINYIYICHP